MVKRYRIFKLHGGHIEYIKDARNFDSFEEAEKYVYENLNTCPYSVTILPVYS